jgi:hypothetical protein
MTASEMIATAAHLHVAMRRKMGRVTDVEWMATNPAYALAMTALARQHATDQQDDDLLKWSDKLSKAWAEKTPTPVTARPTVTNRTDQPSPAVAERYVVGLRC